MHLGGCLSATARQLQWGPTIVRPDEISSATIVELALDAIVSIDHEGRIVEFNPSAERMFGYSRSAMMGQSMAERIIPAHLRSAHYAGLERYLATGEAHVLGRRLELEAMRADGSTFPIELAIVRLSGVEPPVFASYIRDLSRERRAIAGRQLLLDASAALSSSLDYEETLRNLSRVVIPALADWYFVDVKDGKQGGVKRIHVDHRDPAKLALARALEEGYPSVREDRGVVAVVRTGKTEWMREIPSSLLEESAESEEHLGMLRELGLRSYVVAPLSAHGAVYGALGVISAESGRLYDEDDVALIEELGKRAGQAVQNARLFTEVEDQRQQLQNYQAELEAQATELEESRDEANEANRAKSEFLAAMSHELRTPLNAILGYTDLLATDVHGQTNDEQKDRLARVKRSAQHLLALINNVLNFARIEAGRVEYDVRVVPVAEVLDASEEILLPQIGAKNLRYELQSSCGEIGVSADREKLVQILVNLLTNAVRHTGEGGQIQVSCERAGDDVLVKVCDTGPGIPPEKLEVIFEPFVQVEDVYQGQRSGVGLGLPISRRLARGMRGDVTAHSDRGNGSTFTVRLPAA
jgi:PAS domain S-box-containing protein